jgi:hypothetical protein
VSRAERAVVDDVSPLWRLDRARRCRSMSERRMLKETTCARCGQLMRTVPDDDDPRCVFCARGAGDE